MNIWNQLVEKVNNQRDRVVPCNFYLKAEDNGFLPYNTATITMRAFRDKGMSEEVEQVQVRWYR